MCEQANDWYNYCQLWMQRLRSFHSNCKHCGEKPFQIRAIIHSWFWTLLHTPLAAQCATFAFTGSKIETLLPNSDDDGGSRKHVSHASINSSHFDMAGLVASGREGREEEREGGLNKWQANGHPGSVSRSSRRAVAKGDSQKSHGATPLTSGAFPSLWYRHSSLFLWMAPMAPHYVLLSDAPSP